MELGAELGRGGGDHARARAEIERGRAERWGLGQVDRQPALAHEQLGRGDVHAPAPA